MPLKPQPCRHVFSSSKGIFPALSRFGLIAKHALSIVCISWIALFSYTEGIAQEQYLQAYEIGDYKKTLELITRELNEYYASRVEDKRIPTGFITTRESVREIDLNLVFRNRKAEHFFIEDNPRLSQLHLYAARCHGHLSDYYHSMNHYIQALRYKNVEPKKDDVIYYEMARLFLKEKYFNAYIDALESAVSLNPENYTYSLELGKALYRTDKKKRAIHHLERYVRGSDTPISPDILLMLGNLNEDIGRFLETEQYYIRYLEAQPDDGNIHFALGHIAYHRTGNHSLALRSLDRALSLLPEKEVYKKSKSYEYKADIALQQLDFEDSVRFYLETVKYQELIATEIASKQQELKELNETIRGLKSLLLKEDIFEKYEEYEDLLDKKGMIETELRRIQNEYGKLNAGKIRWNIAYSLERLEKYSEAIPYYRSSITFDYNANEARKKIMNLELKIKRGY
jgi:tetratricopeptide (TPR) repeat protein